MLWKVLFLDCVHTKWFLPSVSTVFCLFGPLVIEYHTWLGGTEPPALADWLSGADDLLGKDMLDFTGDTWQQGKETNVRLGNASEQQNKPIFISKRSWHFARSLCTIKQGKWFTPIVQITGPSFMVSTVPMLSLSMKSSWVLCTEKKKTPFSALFLLPAEVTCTGSSKKSPVIVRSVPPPRLPPAGNTEAISAEEGKGGSENERRKD